GRFEHALADVSAAVLAARPELRCPTGGGLDQEVVADRLEACRVGEARYLQLAEFGRLCISSDHRADGTVRRNRDRAGTFGYRDRRLDEITLLRDKLPFGRTGKIARAGVAQLPAR